MNGLFSDEERTSLSGLAHQARQASKGMALDGFYVALHFMVTLFVIGFEWELAYTLFLKIGGDEGSTWNPFVMGLSALVLVLGFHYVVETRTGQKTQFFIHWLSAKVLPIYALGFGLVVLLLLLKDGLFAMLQADDEVFALVETVTSAPTEGDWFSMVVAQFVTPSAALLFAVGVGTLAILNIFVAHSAIAKITCLMNGLSRKIHIQQESRALMQVIAQLEAALKEKQDALSKAVQKDEDVIAAELAAEIHATLQEAMLRPQLWLERQRSQKEASCFSPKQSPHPRLKIVGERLKAYEALSLDAITHHLQISETSK